MGLFANKRSWLSIEFRYGIPEIVTTRNRSEIGRNPWHWKKFPLIPTNSGITTYMGLFANDRSWLSIKFRYGIPGIGTTRNRLEMVYEFKGITSNTEVFLRKVGVFHFCVDVMSAVPWHPHFAASMLVTVPWHLHFGASMLVTVPWQPLFGGAMLVTVPWDPRFAVSLLWVSVGYVVWCEIVGEYSMLVISECNSHRFFFFRFRNSERNWMIEWLVKQISILWHVLIPEFQGIPTNSVFVQFRNKKEFRGTAGN
jgi:hypothetical protein